eukprot:TRINITY_DN18716_c0_g1_i4.p1 TRINITY_DN18716_c0_g1~~TRINITY_DN18716_c0_g1_i4.p1  ORF type:complete len:751 (-),score=179.00 TRINITY_DN18716_c0_g1_i4:721-2973(-)
MDRKSPYHVDMDRKSDRRESMRPGSVTSSELSDTSSIGKKSSAPKVVAVIIVSLVIVAILVGVTIYMIDIEKEKQQLEREERIEEGIETEIDFAEAANAFKAANEDMTEKTLLGRLSASDLRKKADIYEGLSQLSEEQIEHLKNLNQRRRFLENFQKSKQEDFLRPTEEEKAYISSLISNRKSVLADVGSKTRKEDFVTQMSSSSTKAKTTSSFPRTRHTSQDLEFGGVGLFGNRPSDPADIEEEQAVTDSDEEIYETPTIANHNHRHMEMDDQEPPRTIQSMKGNLQSHRAEGEQPYGGDIYDMGSYVKQTQTPMMPNRGNTPRRNFRQRPRLLRPGLEGYRRIDNMEEMANPMESMEASVMPRDRYDLPVDNIEMAGTQDKMTDTNVLLREERPIIPLNKGQVGNEPGLATIDRRPGRPTFHHQGPMGNNGMGMRPFGRRRFINPGAMRLRQGLETPKDQLATESLIRNKVIDTAATQDEILSNFDTFLKLAGSELGSLRNVAKNITQSGKEVNLWEILAAVNETVRKSPDSSISQLMAKFENKYLSEGALDTPHPAEAVYERSLSSLLFLSMGIFLLNSVNELVETGNLPEGEARSMPTNVALENLVKDPSRHAEVFKLFNSTAFDFFDHQDGHSLMEVLKPGNPASTVNNYVRLAMNLMNAYVKDSSEFECIYAAYCYEVNQQAKLGGMASSVAKINSVGLRLALKELSSSATLPALAQSLWSWQDLECDVMFPSCHLGMTKVEKS